MGVEISELRNALGRDVYRNSLFQLQISVPGLQFGNDPKFSCLVISASIPEATVGVVTLPALGRELYLAGDRKFPDFSCRVLNDDSWTVRKYFEQWSALINGYNENIGASFSDYVAQIVVTPLARSTGKTPITTYTLQDAWLNSVGKIELSKTADQHSEFDVSMKVNGVIYSAGT